MAAAQSTLGVMGRIASLNRERDVNYLLHRQQVSLICARTTHSVKGRAAYEDLARGYTDQVDPYRRHNEKLILRAH